MSTYAERLAAAGSAQKGMMVLAEGIDAILAAVTAPTEVDSWSTWAVESADTRAPHADPEDRAVAINAEHALAAARLEAIADMEALLLVTVDPEDAKALEAKLRLLKDDGKPIEPAVEEGIRLTVDGDLVGLPVASQERQQARWLWAASHTLHTFQSTGNALTEGEMADAFAKGGPMWLYLFDRDAVMRMTDTMRRDMIADLEIDSPAEAQEMARDILKDLTPEGARDAALGYVAAGSED